MNSNFQKSMVLPYLLSLLLAPLVHGGNHPTTLAENSEWKQTGRYAEVEKLCKEFQSSYPGKIHCFQFGTTPEARPMMALVASQDGKFTPKQSHAAGRPVILAQGGIHAGEIDGKDAGFLLLKELLSGKVLPGVLAKTTFVFVPVFNVDGHERFGKYNRPNQIGPEEMGWRTNALNLNLNRDYAKIDAPEMAAMLKLLQNWDPLVYVDLHVSDGAEFQPDTWLNVYPSRKGATSLFETGNAISDELMARLKTEGHLPLPFYASFVDENDPASGFKAGIAPPRFSHAYWALHNRFGILVETHSWKDYAARVKVTRDVLVNILDLTARDGKIWLARAHKADEEARALEGTDLVLTYVASDKSHNLEFPGFVYRREKSEISGQMKVTYDSSRKEMWHVPFFNELVAKTTVKVPHGGYIIPPAHAHWVADKLRDHGIRFQELKKGHAPAAVEVFRAQTAKFSPISFESHMPLTVEGVWSEETREIPAGSLYVPVAQELGVLVEHLFEPKAPDSFLSWGFFNNHFEKKEYMEDYVAEKVATEMLAADPALKKEFEKQLSDDKEFAKSPAKRLEFFYRRHPSWDERLNLYPVFRGVLAD